MLCGVTSSLTQSVTHGQLRWPVVGPTDESDKLRAAERNKEDTVREKSAERDRERQKV